MQVKLTKAEEDIMHFIWSLEPCTVSQILAEMKDPPPHSTVSSVVRILEKKGFVEHVAYGRTHVYTSVIKKDEYARRSITSIVSDYFDGSVTALLSFLAKKDEISLEDVETLIKEKNKES